MGAWILAALLTAGGADREEVRACIHASTRGQELRDQGDLLGAKAQLKACASNACPQAIRSDCTRWLADVEQATPSVVVAIREGLADVAGARVTVDGAPFPSEGRAVELNPGRHTFSAEKDGVSRRLDVLVSVAERNRLVVIQFSDARAPATVAPLSPVRPPEPAPLEPAPPASVSTVPTASTRVPWGPLVLSGVGVAGVAVFIAVGVSAQNELSGLESRPCAKTSSCPPGFTDGVRTKYVIADVGLAVGAAAVAGAALWYFWPSSSTVAAYSDGHGLGASWRVSF